MKLLVSFLILIFAIPINNLLADSHTIVIVNKTNKILQVKKSSEIVLEIPISLGFEPSGAKKEEGDGKTPEGKYKIDYVINDWDYYKAMHISYPNATQIAEAKKKNINPGGGILIHGMRPRWNWVGRLHSFINWTHGCIAVTNEEMDQLFKLVPVGSSIIIDP
ncbi:L,D-transpeptidase family protein [Leptospira sp. GIMC2001]|uniref:L,D-transpeptidase family protein n=1 Tax=Leptospira sp. GIMC2001 TaxID=1513297 RepID=UPI00234A94B9|nr:L,D-transpeptidase family protein [Leptospira sp. GIMC2001]WCL49161.1 L,D-transpeptidase family protein [Leptospira sp. GIMC2001]